MKQKLSHIFAVFVALVIAIPIANAYTQPYSSYRIHIPTTHVWKTDYNESAIGKQNITKEPGFYRQGAASLANDRIYSAVGGTSTHIVEYDSKYDVYTTFGYYMDKDGQSYWSGGSKNETMPYGSGNYYYLGPGIASDEEGTLWCTAIRSTEAPNKSPWATGAKAFLYYNPTLPSNGVSGDRNGLNLYSAGVNVSDRADFMSVSGKGVGGTASFWFLPQYKNIIECVIIEKGKAKKKVTLNAPMTNAGPWAYVKQFSKNRIIYNPQGDNDQTDYIYLGTIEGLPDSSVPVSEEFLKSDKTEWNIKWEKTHLKVQRHGSTAFMLRGHGIIAYSADLTTIKLYDWTAGRELGTITTTFPSAKGSVYVSHSMDAKVVDDEKVELYVYTPAGGGARYTITTSLIEESVSNIKATYVNGSSREITISWDDVEDAFAKKYRIRYSTDGGATWLETIETEYVENVKAEPSYTFKNLPQGTYTFEITPLYYYEVREDAWGKSATANIVVDPVGGVTNLDVQTSSDSPFSALVNWNMPAEGTPSKYAVSYSTDGGSTWSTAVETTDLTKTLTNLAPGSYKFKVRPFYTVSWGDETVSGSEIVYGVSAPVTNLSVAYNNNQGNSIIVSWNKPTAPVDPDKYQACYSIDNGNSWSTAVETTDLSYIFEDLAIGSYKFKVTPYYNKIYPGDDATSESIDVSEATGIKFTTTKEWEVKGEPEGALFDQYDGRGLAVSNGKAYVIAAKHLPNIFHIDKDTKDNQWDSFESGFAKQRFGYAIDNDDAGNIIVQTNASIGSAATQFSIYPAGALSKTGKIDITLEGDYLPGGRADFIGAQGNLLSSGGGYVWIIPQDQKKLMRISIVNGALYGVATWRFADSFYNTFLAKVTQPVVRPMPDGRIYIHPRGNGYKIITLPEYGQEITASMVENISATGSSPSSNMSSDIFVLQGHTFHVRNDGAKTQSIGITIENLTEDGNGDATFTPFEGIDKDGNANGISGISAYGSLVRAVEVNQNNVDIYCYSPNHGVTVYRVSAKATYFKTDKLSSLSYNYLESTDAEGNKVQDIKLTWEAPKDATPSKYKVYRDGSLLATVDASTLTYTDNGVTQNHTYKVVPIFTGVNEDAEHGLSVTTTEVETILYAPIITEVRNYNGYSIVELFYKMPEASKVKSSTLSYNIYRNDEKIASGLTQYNFIDDNLPKTKEAHTYTYKVEVVYDSSYDNTTRMSEDEVVIVAPREWALQGYKIEPIYNVPINNALGNLPNNFTNHEYYRQGHFYNGHWYIAQLSDQLHRKDQGISNGAINKSEVAGATGGVVAIKATEEHDVRAGFIGKVVSNDEFASTGLAVDDKGTIFVRHNNLDKVKATIQTGLTWSNIVTYDAFDRRITEGALYTRNADGTYSSEPTIIDLSALWLDNRWIDNMNYTGQTSYGQLIGRSDYYNMYGDVMSAEGGYLLLSPSWTRTIFKVKIANGKYVNHETHELNEYQSANGMVAIKNGTENYGFKIAGRDAWMAQIRSNGYYGIHGEEENHEDGHKHEMHAIFVTDSRINNSGGTSIVAFDNPNTPDVNEGEIFLITPASMHSRNQGDFIVTRGIRESVNADVKDAKLMPPMAVAQYEQTTQNVNVATNANGNWFHAEIGTYESATGEESECIYIYQYVPGVRFAKYRIFADNQYPAIFPTLDITTAYNDDETEITHFEGVATWKRPEGFGTSENVASNANVMVKSYTFELYNAKGEKIYEAEVADKDYAAGTTPTVESENIVYKFDYYVDKNIASESECDLDFQTYTARVAVNYEFSNSKIQQSEFGSARASNDYDAEKASDLAVHVFKKEKVTEYVWVENPNTTETTEDDWVAVPKEFDTYRVELDFNPPAWSADANPEPISYYTVKALVNNQTDLIEITDFHLHTGAEVVNGVEKATYEVASQIPGTYNFSQYNKGGNKAPYYHTIGKDYGVGGESRRAGVLTWHHKVDYGQYTGSVATTAEGDEIVITDEPNKWVFIVEAHYGAKNRYIAKSAEASIGVEDQKYIETGVEVVGDNTAALKIYPIPATTSITVKASEAINSIVIYNEAGVEVINEMGNGENITMVNIENLSTGFYFVKVNNYEPVKIIKK